MLARSFALAVIMVRTDDVGECFALARQRLRLLPRDNPTAL